MAKVVSVHSKYKGVIVSKTDMRKLRDTLNRKVTEIRDDLIQMLCYIGEECVKVARENGSYSDITGNLRSSIGYVVLYDGQVVQESEGKMYKGRKGNGAAGVPAAQSLLSKLKAQFPWGLVLIVCAGMKYAAYVESVRGKDVLTSAELRSDQLVKSLLGKLTKSS